MMNGSTCPIDGNNFRAEMIMKCFDRISFELQIRLKHVFCKNLMF